MLKVRTKDWKTDDRADIYCARVDNFGRWMFLEAVEQIDGSVDVLDYHHSENEIHVYINPADVVFITTA